MTAKARGGVLGPDYVHPTPSGQRLIAMGELYLLERAAGTTTDGTLGGYRKETLEKKFQEAAEGLQEYILTKDRWIPEEVKKSIRQGRRWLP